MEPVKYRSPLDSNNSTDCTKYFVEHKAAAEGRVLRPAVKRTNKARELLRFLVFQRL